MSKKQQNFAKAQENANKARDLANTKVDKELPWQEDGRVVDDSVNYPSFDEEDDSVIESVVSDDTFPQEISEGEERKEEKERLNPFELAKETTSAIGSMVYSQFGKYLESMKPRLPLKDKEGALNQKYLLNTLLLLFNKVPGDEFKEVFNNVLEIVDSYRDAQFSETYAFRFANAFDMTDEEYQAFRSLVTLLLMTSNKKTRHEQIKMVKNWDHLLGYGLTEEGKNKIRHFFNIRE